MKPSAARPIRPSTGPTPLLVQHASAVLVITRLLPPSSRPLQVEQATLERFSALMAREGWRAHVSRLAFDRVYAHERFAIAKRRGGPELAALGEELLGFHRRGAPGR
jgi:hypothetical protein